MSVLKTILFIVVVYLVIRVVSNMFLPSGKKKNSKARFFYQTFKNVRDQQKKQKQRRQQNKEPDERLDEIEEAEFKDVTDEEDDADQKDES